MQRFAVATVFAFALLQIAKSAGDSNGLDEFGPPETVAPIVELIQKTLSEFSELPFPGDDDPPPLIVTLDVPRNIGDDFVDLPGFASPRFGKDAEQDDVKIPQDLNPEAVLAPILQLFHQSLMNMPPPNRDASNVIIPLGSSQNGDEKVNFHTVDYLPGGMRVKVLHRSFVPPTQTVLASGKLDGHNVNQFQQKKMYSTQDFAIVQSPKKETPKTDDKSAKPDDEKKEASAPIPQDIMDDLETLVKMTDDVKYDLP